MENGCPIEFPARFCCGLIHNSWPRRLSLPRPSGREAGCGEVTKQTVPTKVGQRHNLILPGVPIICAVQVEEQPSSCLAGKGEAGCSRRPSRASANICTRSTFMGVRATRAPCQAEQDGIQIKSDDDDDSLSRGGLLLSDFPSPPLAVSASTQATHSSSAASPSAVSEHLRTPSSRVEEITAPHSEISPTASGAPTEETASANHTTHPGSSPPPRPTNSTTREGGNTTTAAPLTTPLASSREPLLTSREAGSASHNSTTAESGEDAPISQKPGLVAIICIFVIILLIGAVVVLVKCYKGREPAFQKLDEVPMGKVTEGSPFAHFPPK
uniref:mucin-5AC-like n=1 Tax=Podarcis muralis TaxID=64176 RepID=UPI0010A094E8|nr:mucin-5AC-like [Podarcis muralis]